MTRPRRRGPLLALAMLVLLLLAGRATGISPALFWSRRAHLGDILTKMLPPDWAYLSHLPGPLWATVQMSVTGTVLGSVLGLALAPLCASNLRVPAPLRWTLRALVQLVRTFPALILALTATFLFGIGSFAGTAALTVYTFAIMARLTCDDAQSADLSAYEALLAMGTGPYRAFFRSVWPALSPTFLTNALYMLETNVRHSAILGYVGAGGVGLLLNEKMSWREYDRVGAILLALFLAVCLIESLSAWLIALVTGRRKAGRTTRRVLTGALTALFCLCAVTVGRPDFSRTSLRTVGAMLDGLLRPDWAFFFQGGTGGLGWLLLETVCIALTGTALGALVSFPLALLGSGRLVSRPVAVLGRTVCMAVRSVPFLVYGLIFIRVTGPGAFTGVLTIAMCSVGLLSKRFIQAIDTVDMRPCQALAAMGTPGPARIRHGLLPLLAPAFGAAVLYRFDVNIREASVLGLVGAGGIGAPLVFAMNHFQWPTAGAIAVGLVLLVWAIDWLSTRLGKN